MGQRDLIRATDLQAHFPTFIVLDHVDVDRAIWLVRIRYEVFKGVLAVRAKDITENMKIAAAHAIAAVIPEEELNPEYVIPSSFDKRVALAVANAVAKAAVEEGINRVPYTEIK